MCRNNDKYLTKNGKSIPGEQCNCYVTEPVWETAILCIAKKISNKAKSVCQDCVSMFAPGLAGLNFAATLTKERR